MWGGKVKVSCNVIDDRILTDYDLSLTEKELTEIINTSWWLLLKILDLS